MKRRAIVAIAGMVLSGSARATLPVFDASSFAKMEESVLLLREEVSRLESTYAAMSGSRGLGSVLYDPALREYLPTDWMRVYDAANAGGYAGISGPMKDIERAERLQGTVAEGVLAVRERAFRTAVTNKAIALHAFDGERARLTEIESLMQRIDETHDPKGVAEIEARIAAEEAVVQNESTKLELVAMLERAEEALRAEQAREVLSKIMSPKNTGMPSCCSAR